MAASDATIETILKIQAKNFTSRSSQVFKFFLIFFGNILPLNGTTLQNFSLFNYLTNMFHWNVSRLKILPLLMT